MTDGAVSLRPLVMRDVPRLVEICNQMQVAKYLAHMPHPFSPKDAKRFVTIGFANPDLVFGIVLDRLLVGALHLCGQLEYFLDPKVWGRGIATSAVAQAIDHVFAYTDNDKIETGYFHANTASGRVLEKLGFVKGAHRMMGTRHLQMAIHQTVVLQRSHWRHRFNAAMDNTFGAIANNTEN